MNIINFKDFIRHLVRAQGVYTRPTAPVLILVTRPSSRIQSNVWAIPAPIYLSYRRSHYALLILITQKDYL